MSALKHILEVSPTKYSDSKEVMYVKDIECSRCNGRGGFSEETDHDKYVFIPCDLCNGTKRIKATITIEWGPDYGV